jgi:hypothetical protein
MKKISNNDGLQEHVPRNSQCLYITHLPTTPCTTTLVVDHAEADPPSMYKDVPPQAKVDESVENKTEKRRDEHLFG